MALGIGSVYVKQLMRLVEVAAYAQPDLYSQNLVKHKSKLTAEPPIQRIKDDRKASSYASITK